MSTESGKYIWGCGLLRYFSCGEILRVFLPEFGGILTISRLLMSCVAVVPAGGFWEMKTMKRLPVVVVEAFSKI
jgi:hypothetical protein